MPSRTLSRRSSLASPAPCSSKPGTGRSRSCSGSTTRGAGGGLRSPGHAPAWLPAGGRSCPGRRIRAGSARHGRASGGLHGSGAGRGPRQARAGLDRWPGRPVRRVRPAVRGPVPGVRHRRPAGGGPGRVLSRRPQRERAGRGEARRDGAADGHEGVAVQLLDRGRGRGPAPTRAGRGLPVPGPGLRRELGGVAVSRGRRYRRRRGGSCRRRDVPRRSARSRGPGRRRAARARPRTGREHRVD